MSFVTTKAMVWHRLLASAPKVAARTSRRSGLMAFSSYSNSGKSNNSNTSDVVAASTAATARFKSTVAASYAIDSEDEAEATTSSFGQTLPMDLDDPHNQASLEKPLPVKEEAKSAFSGDRNKSGSPSPWAVFDAWGAGADTVLSVSPEEEAKLSAAAVRIPIEGDGSQDKLPEESEILAAYDHLLQGKSSSHFGYPYNLMFDYTELMPFLKYSINNLGDPFVPSNYGVHSRQFEVAVIDFFANLWKMEKDSYWGYVTTSGTEGNLHGMLLARECFPDGILYTSQETHYSVFKAARYYRMECQSIPTLPMGEINYDILAAAIRKNSHRPVILNVNIGTTVKGAVDNLDRILRILKQEQIPREKFYIHCDGALFALMMPFIDFAPEISFRKPIDSIAVSGHKMLGCPMPCGVTLSRKEHVTRLEQHIDYLNSVDTTIMGSRNGQAALYLWYSLRKKGIAGIKRDVVHCMDTARYLRDKLTEAGLTSALNDLSSTVVLEKPMDDKFIQRWQLACEEDIAHVVVMPNVTKYKIDKFVEELVQVTKTHGRVQPTRPDSPLTKLGQSW
jgi:histidine decarboxylase